jgi:hypothetical protein
MIRSHDVGQLTTAELERARRELQASLGLIKSGSPANVRSRLKCEQSTPSLPNVPAGSRPAGINVTAAKELPARRLPSLPGGRGRNT